MKTATCFRCECGMHLMEDHTCPVCDREFDVMDRDAAHRRERRERRRRIILRAGAA